VTVVEVSLGVIMTNTEIVHIFHIISLFNLPFFHIFPIFSLFNLLFQNVKNIFLSIRDVKLFLTFASLGLVLL
jgi:hypothetical protein